MENEDQTLYPYIGPTEIKERAPRFPAGHLVRNITDLAEFLSGATISERCDPFTFIIDEAGLLRIAPRRSEHVACAGGQSVRSAGEMGFSDEAGSLHVCYASNLSTGYCPDATSWDAVETALEAIGIDHPEGFTTPIIFRQCPDCQQWNVVKDSDYFCTFCSAALPT